MRLGYPARFVISKRERYRSKEVVYRVSFWGIFELQKFAFEIIPYFCHINKIKNLIEVIKQENYLKITRIEVNNNIKKLIYNAKERCGDFKLLIKRLNMGGLQISSKGVEAWVYQLNRISVYAILKMCEIMISKDFFSYIPKELAFSLWLNGYISRKKAEDLRGIKNVYKHVESIIKEIGIG